MNQVLYGDCLDLMRVVPDKSIDMILCDLPYGCTKNVWDSPLPLKPLCEQYERIISDNGAILLTAIQPFATKLILSNEKLFRYDLIWEKSIATGFLNSKRMPLRSHELCLVFYKKLPIYNPQKNMLKTLSFKNKVRGESGRSSSNYGKYKANVETGSKDGSRYPRSVFSITTESEFFDSSKKGQTIHPTQKPVGLFEYLIRTYTNEGAVVLDNCAGSGTTAIACVNSDRKYILMEKERRYFESIIKRLADHNPG